MIKALKYPLYLLIPLLFYNSVLSQQQNELPELRLSGARKFRQINPLHLADLRNEALNLTPLSFDSIQNKKYQKNKEAKYKVVPWRMTLLGVVGAGVLTGMHIYYKNTWWKDQRRFFKFAQDGYYAKDIDKISHVYTANVFTEATATTYEWTGLSPKSSLLWGAVTAMAYETYIEINDGFAPIWGFDWSDMGANLLGALYPFIQKEVPVLRNFTFKWSFRPKWLAGKVENENDLLDDYTNMTFWLGISPKGLLPKDISKYYPGFLGIAIGVSLKNANHTIGGSQAYRELFLSLDYDITKLPGNTEFLKKLKKILNFYHFPAPAVRVSPSGIWYGLYF